MSLDLCCVNLSNKSRQQTVDPLAEGSDSAGTVLSLHQKLPRGPGIAVACSSCWTSFYAFLPLIQPNDPQLFLPRHSNYRLVGTSPRWLFELVTNPHLCHCGQNTPPSPLCPSHKHLTGQGQLPSEVVTMASTALDAQVKAEDAPPTAVKPSSRRDYKGFVAGVFSGIAKLTGEKPTPPIH